MIIRADDKIRINLNLAIGTKHAATGISFSSGIGFWGTSHGRGIGSWRVTTGGAGAALTGTRASTGGLGLGAARPASWKGL